MFEISELKEKTLADLQVVAKSIGLTKTSQLKKLDLVYQILDTQAANPVKVLKLEESETTKAEKPKRRRVVKQIQPKKVTADTNTLENTSSLEKNNTLDKYPTFEKSVPTEKTGALENKTEVNRVIEKRAPLNPKVKQERKKSLM